MPRQKQGQSTNQVPDTPLVSNSPSSRFLAPQAREFVVMSAAGQTAARSMQEMAASTATGSWTTINGNLNKTNTRSSTPLSSVPSDPTPTANVNYGHTTTRSDSDPQQLADEEDIILADAGHWADESTENAPAEKNMRGKTWTPEEHAQLLEILQHLKSTFENGENPVEWSDSRIYQWASDQLIARGYDRTRQACSNYWRRKGAFVSGFHISESSKRSTTETGEAWKGSKVKKESLKRHSEGGSIPGGSASKKRNRGPIKKLLPEEKEILVRQGHISLFPSKETERALANELGWEAKRVSIWYSNTRRMGLHGFPITHPPPLGESYQTEDSFAAEPEDESAIMDDYAADGDFADESEVRQEVSSASPAPYGTRSAEKRKANVRDHNMTPNSTGALNERDDSYDVVSPPRRRPKRNSTPTSRKPVVPQAWAAVSAEPMAPVETRARAASHSKMVPPDVKPARTPLVSSPAPLPVRANPAKRTPLDQRPNTPTKFSSAHGRPTSSRGSPKNQRKHHAESSTDSLLSSMEHSRDDLENKKLTLERNRSNYASSLADLEGLCVSFEQEIEDMQKKLRATRRQIADRQRDGTANEVDLKEVTGSLEDINDFIQKRKARLGL